MRVWSVVTTLVLVSSLLTGGSVVAQTGTCFGQPPTIVDNGPGDLDPRPHYITGTTGPDVILGTEEADVIDGGGASGGGELICGLGGKDEIQDLNPLGLPQLSFVDGGDGNDTITVTGGEWIVTGGPGDDTLRGNAIFSNFDGGEGNDTLIVSMDRGTVSGGPGNDFLQVQAFASRVFGGDGNDEMIVSGSGGEAKLVIDGGAGQDTIQYGGGLLTDILGSQGNDRISVGSGFLITVDGGPGNDTIGAADATVFGPGFPPDYIVRGGDGNDQLTIRGTGPHLVEGGPGQDVLSGGSADTLDGGPASDVCRGGSGTVFLNCEVTRTLA